MISPKTSDLGREVESALRDKSGILKSFNGENCGVQWHDEIHTLSVARANLNWSTAPETPRAPPPHPARRFDDLCTMDLTRQEWQDFDDAAADLILWFNGYRTAKGDSDLLPITAIDKMRRLRGKIGNQVELGWEGRSTKEPGMPF